MYLEDNTSGQNWKVIRCTGLNEKFNKSNDLEGIPYDGHVNLEAIQSVATIIISNRVRRFKNDQWDRFEN